MKTAFCKRVISLCLLLGILLSLLPANVFAVEADSKATTRAATDLTSTINGLTAPIQQTNTLLNNVTASSSGQLVGTYFIVNKDSSGTYRIIDPLANGTNGKLVGKTVTIKNNSVQGADPSLALDIIHSSSNTYHTAASNGLYFREFDYNLEPAVAFSDTTSLPFGYNFINSTTEFSIRIYRRFYVGTANDARDLRYNGNGEFDWILSGQGYNDANKFYLYKIAQRWDTEQLYNAIQEMKGFASANNGRYPDALHQAFMECMESSIALYKKYNVATASETYDQVAAIRSELKAQTQWLLSYKNVLQASYAEAVSNLPATYNEKRFLSFKDYLDKEAASFGNNTYYLVNMSSDGKSGKLVDISTDYSTGNYFTARDVTISDGHVVGADGNWSIRLDTSSSNANWVRLTPTNGLRPSLNGIHTSKDYYQLAHGTHDTALTYSEGKLTFAVHPADISGDGVNDHYYLTYKSDVNGFRFWKNWDKVNSADNVFALFDVAEQSIALGNAIHSVEGYLIDNSDGKYPADLYNQFISCLVSAIKLYQQYNVALNTTDAAEFATIKETMESKAEELFAYRSKLTTADTTAEYIDIPVEFYDFRADALFFEFFYGHYNMGGSDAPGSPSSHGRIGLTSQTLTNRKITYTQETVDYIVDAMYDLDSISTVIDDVRYYSKDIMDGAAPGWNNVFYNMLPTMSDSLSGRGSYEETIAKTENGELRWAQVTTYYDLAYYLLTYLWRPVNPEDIVDTENNLPYNTTVTQRDRLRLYASETGIYTLDVAMDTATDGYYIYNTQPTIPTTYEMKSAYFRPIDGFGFETPEILAKVGGDTDRGGVYSTTEDHEMEDTNFHYTMHAYGSFVYYESQNLYFDFVGDDDVYFFIDGEMALDIGGAHSALGARINLNDIAGKLGLMDGEVYDFDMFYAERHTTASNLKFSTNIKIVDTDTLTTMGQYALTYNGVSKVDSQTGMGAAIIDNGAVFVGDTTAYSFELTNTRQLPVYNISFVSPTLGTNISKDSLTLYKADLSNGAVTNIKDITVYYRTVTQDEADNNIINASLPTEKSYSDMKSMLTTAINKNGTLAEGCYRVAISSEAELKTLLALGIPNNCQISVYGFKRITTQVDTPFTNKLTSQCSYTRVASNEGSANGEVFTLNGIASRMLRVSSALPSIDTQQIVLDYGKKVQLPIDTIAAAINTDSFVSITGLAGITFTGNHGEVLKNQPAEFGLTKANQSWQTHIGRFIRTESGVEFELVDFMDEIQTVYLVYSLSGCEISDPDGTVTTYKYFLVQLQLIPATSVYYETDFAGGVFDLNDQPESMFFDFTNSAEEQTRFAGAPYGGYNFSQEENAHWATRSTRSDAKASSDFVINNADGTMSVNVAPGFPMDDTTNYGPWITTTRLYGNYPATSNGKYHPLSYIPNKAEYIQIRFKVEGCEVARVANPRVVVVYDYMKDGTYPGAAFAGRDYTMIGEYSYIEGEYQVVTLPVSDNFKNADLVTTFGFRFWDLKSVNNGKITIDYIYVGTAAGLPTQADDLYFDFDKQDDGHYASEIYAYTNFDDPAKVGTTWKKHSPVNALSIDSEAGTLQLELKDLGTGSWPGYYITTGQLNYSPENVEIIEIRFKMEDLVQGTQNTTKKDPYFAFGVYETLDGENITLSNEYDVPVEHIADGEWITIRRDLRNVAALKTVKNIAGLRLYFGGVESESATFGKLGTITIDYIYIGKEADAPNQDYLYFDFNGTQEDRIRYENPIYGGFNFDYGNWATSANGGSSKYTIDREAGTITINVQNRESDIGPYFATTNTPGSYPSQNNKQYAPLNYLMPENAVFQIRFKMASVVVAEDKAPNIGLIMHYTDTAGADKYSHVDSMGMVYSLVDEDAYITLTIPMKSVFKGNEMLHSVGMRFRNVNGNTTGSITIDYIYVGSQEDAPAAKYLFFGFTNSETDRERYADPIYGGFNYDIANWATGQTVNSKAFAMNPTEGTVAVTVKAGDTGPYFATTNNTGSYPWSGSPNYAPLNYPVPAGAVLKVRFKVDNCTLTDTSPNIAVLLHYVDSAGTKAYNTSLGSKYAYIENDYVTLTVPTTKLFSGNETLRSVGFRFRNLNGLGTVTIDYIYVGLEEDFQKALAENGQIWQTVTDGTTSDNYQDVGLAQNQSTVYSIGKAIANRSAEQSNTRSANLRAAAYTPPTGMTLKAKTDKTIMEGVTESTITMTHNSKPLAVFATTINADAQATMKVSYSGYYSAGSTEKTREALNGNLAWKTMRTTEQAANYEAATGNTVLFAMNGGFPKSGASRGPLVMEGNLIQPFLSTVKDEPMFAVLKDGSYAILDYTDDFSNVEEGLGLRQWLVKDGVNVTSTLVEEDNLVFPTHPRTAIGVKADGSVVCVVVDGRQEGYSDLGLTLNDLADLMISLGCVRAANMDGGGSSTFASRYDENEPLTIRNSPSDDTGERTVITALLMISTENLCRHDYSSGTYAISNDGRHSQICDICRQGVDSPHRYTNGVCVCGKTEVVSPNLFFDFTDNAADRERYMTGAYGYRNYDRTQYVNWWQSYWATKASSSKEHLYGDFKINEHNGTLVVNVADGTGADGTATGGRPYGDNGNWGPWLSTAFAYRENPDRYTANTMSLNYDPSQAEIVQIRFKVTGCSLAGTVTKPKVVVVCDYTEGTTLKRDTSYDMRQSYTYVDGEYVTITMDLCEHLKNADAIRSFGFRFWDIYSTLPESDANRGTVTVDYIYVGTREDAPKSDDHFFVDFTNTKADQERYAGYTYGGLNLDLAENWYTNTYLKPVVSDGVMTLTAPEGFGGYGVVNTGHTKTAKPLNYIPSADDYYQIRLRIDDATASNLYDTKKGVGRLVLFYSADPATSNEANFVYYDFKMENEIADRGWVTLTFKISDMASNSGGVKYEDMQVINAFTPCFNWIKSAEGKTATFQIDYIYVGPEDKLPSFNQPVYGYDSSYTDDSKLSNGSSLFVEGAIIPNYTADKQPIYKAGEEYNMVSFDFVGNGFDIISRTGANQGLIRVSVYNEKGEHEKTLQVLNKSEKNLELYQIPVISVEGLPHGYHMVKIYVAEAYDFDDSVLDLGGALDRGGEFYFDAVRIYNPIDVTADTADAVIAHEAYLAHSEGDPIYDEVRQLLITANRFNGGGTMEGIVYLDATGDQSSIINYTAIGPNNEVYLSPGNAIAFKFEVGSIIPASVDVGAKCVGTGAASMLISISSSAPKTKPTGEATVVTSSTAQFYPLNILPSAWQTKSGKSHVYVTICNSGAEGILSITDIKRAYDILVEDDATATSEEKKSARYLVDFEMSQDYVICTQHQWDEGKTEKNATCERKGEMVFTCVNCYETRSEVIPAKGHSYVSEVTAPTCTEEGIAVFSCLICDESYEETIAALGHSFVNGVCVCGAVEITEPVLDGNLSFGAQLYLENDLTMAFRVKSSKLAAYDLSTAYLVVEREVYETGAKEATILTTEICDYTISDDGRVVFSYPGISAAQMNDSIKATLYIKDAEGKEYASPVLETSVATYLNGLLGSYANDSKMLTLIMDMLNYGAAAQVYFDRHADALVNEAFDSFKTYASYASADFTTVLEDLSATTDADGKSGNLNLGLDLGTRIGIQYKVTLPADVAAEDVSLVITDGNGNTLETLSLTGDDVTVDSRGRYVVNFFGSTSKDMRRVVYATAYAKGEAITGTYAYSISTYAWGVQENASMMDAKLVNVTRAMMLYGDSASAYFG